MLLSEFLQKSKKLKTINLFCDLETYQFNESAGYVMPSKFKNQVFSLAVSYIYENRIYCDHTFYDFKGFFDTIEQNVNHICKVKLFFHNGNGYDNHYMLFQILHEYPAIQHRQMFVKQVDPDETAVKNKELKKLMILEKRVKASTNLELLFKLNKAKITYQTVDTLPKTGGRSLRSLGMTMFKMGLIPEDELKSDFNYTKYNLKMDLSYSASKTYAKKIHDNLDDQQLHYIDNDVILLAEIYRNFSKMYPGFDFNKITFSQNILKEYEISPRAKFQLTARIDYKRGIKYSNYDFRGENLFDYLKHFYKGGLNFYNDKKLTQVINREIYSLDINSSYPYVMDQFRIPYTLQEYSEDEDIINVQYDDNFYMYEISDDEFNSLVAKIPSMLMRKMITKYYSGFYKNTFINTNTLKTINMHAHTKITKLHVLAYLKFDTKYFAARNIIEENYSKKTQGKNTHMLDCSDITNIKVLPEINKILMSPEEYAQSKVILNGIYGLPALRPYYNYFRYDYENDELISVPKGFANTERNELFSIFVTSQAFYNLLTPLQNMSGEEIDQYLYYGDTDSLYLDAAVIDKVPPKLINDLNLGAFKLEHHIKKIYLLNHKKYAYQLYESDPDFKKYKNGIVVHAGGVPLDSFNMDMSFEEFVKTQFSPGVKIKSTRNYRTDSGTIAIYNAEIKLDKGLSYPVHIDGFGKEIAKIVLHEKVKDNDERDKQSNENILYIESPFGNFSIDAADPKNHNRTNRELKYLVAEEKFLLKNVKE